MRWSAVIFDLDGLMIDSEPISLDVWRVLAAEYDREVSEDLYRTVIGEEPIYGVRVIRAALELPMGEAELLEQYWSRRTVTMCEKVRPAPGLIELLDLLNERSVRLAVASNSPCHYVEAVLEPLGLAGFFECVRSSEDVENGKPSPDVYQSTLTCLEVDANEALALEDSPAGVAAAKSAGLTCFAVPNGELAAEDFSSADEVFESLDMVFRNIQFQFEL